MASTSTEKLFIISAPSGAGKTTLVRALLRTFLTLSFQYLLLLVLLASMKCTVIITTFICRRIYRAQGKRGFSRMGGGIPWSLLWHLFSEIDRIFSRGNYPIFDVDVRRLNIRKKYGDKAIAIYQTA